MPERERRGRVQVAHPLAALSERWGQVRVWLPSGLARYPDWQLAGGIDPARKHSGQCAAALLAGEEGLDDRCRSALVLAQCVRAARHRQQHGRRTGLQDRLDQLRLKTGQVEILRVAALWMSHARIIRPGPRPPAPLHRRQPGSRRRWARIPIWSRNSAPRTSAGSKTTALSRRSSTLPVTRRRRAPATMHR